MSVAKDFPDLQERIVKAAHRAERQALHGHDGVVGVEVCVREAIAETLAFLSHNWYGPAGCVPDQKVAEALESAQGMILRPWETSDHGSSKR